MRPRPLPWIYLTYCPDHEVTSNNQMEAAKASTVSKMEDDLFKIELVHRYIKHVKYYYTCA